MESELLARIAAALERLSPPPRPAPLLDGADAFIWHPSPARLQQVAHVSGVPIDLLHGLSQQKGLLLENTRRFVAGLPANNAMLWGARGMGKSSLVKAVHAASPPGSLALIEIAREDIASLPTLLEVLRASPRRCLVFCDDLSFEREDQDYKALKSVLDGGIAGRPANVLLYATSNRRHLMPRDMIDNERATAIQGGEAADEKISLSDRFGLWLGFHKCDQPTFLAMVDGYASQYGLNVAAERLHAEAVEWSMIRGGRSGRVAAQFIADLAGRLEIALPGFVSAPARSDLQPPQP